MPTAFYAVGIVYMIARPNFVSALDRCGTTIL